MSLSTNNACHLHPSPLSDHTANGQRTRTCPWALILPAGYGTSQGPVFCIRMNEHILHLYWPLPRGPLTALVWITKSKLYVQQFPHAALAFLCHNPSITLSLPFTCSTPITLLKNSQQMSSEDEWGWPVGISAGIWILLNSTKNVRERRVGTNNARCASTVVSMSASTDHQAWAVFTSRRCGFPHRCWQSKTEADE